MTYPSNLVMLILLSLDNIFPKYVLLSIIVLLILNTLIEPSVCPFLLQPEKLQISEMYMFFEFTVAALR